MATTKAAPKKGAEVLEERLVLHRWITSALGYESTKKMLEDLRGSDEGFDSSGRSGVLLRLLSRGSKLRIPASALENYDQNIRRHLSEINAGRAEPVVLKYFQHTAALFTEIFLDNRFNRPESFVTDLNDYAESLENESIRFDESDLDRSAFWMATGSGKTLLMHLNYHQFLHYNDEPLDNILLITPNERLTEQHLEEMRLSGIPCERFEPEGLRAFGDVVRATEITKLIEEKKGGGYSVDIAAFEGRNLVFVDEGHKGTSSVTDKSKEGAWLRRRRILAENGHTFEYSATFGQALAKGTKNEKNELLSTYGKSILMDYSYRYFYADGYGKDFRFADIKDIPDDPDRILIGNLLSFYEQKLCYEELLGKEADKYNLKAPLWILVGLTVDTSKSDTKGASDQRSDIYNVMRFLHRFTENHEGWGSKAVTDALEDEIFADYFPHLRERYDGSPEKLYRDILRSVFRAESPGALATRSIRGSDGQLGLGVSGSENSYFGLVYVGDPAKLKKLAEDRDEGILLEEDVIGSGLFDGIDNPESPVNVLVGARKFVEGWSSWRVSSMGLINVGQGEGPMIIQLFGRGVRLQGRDFSLKRSSALDGLHPETVAPVETLGVFGIKADAMGKFLKSVSDEGVDTEGYETLPPLPIKTSFLDAGLIIPRPPDEDFVDGENIVLSHDENIKVSLDLSVRFETATSSENKDGSRNVESRTAKSGATETDEIESRYLDLLDWSGIYYELLEFKAGKGFRNLTIPPDKPRKLLDEKFYKLVCPEYVVKPERFDGLFRLRGVVVSLLEKYIEKFYHQHQQRWDTERMKPEVLTEAHGNLAFGSYKVMVKRGEDKLRDELTAMISKTEEFYENGSKDLENLHFDRHLYQPLLLEGKEGVKTTPVGLNASERNFVEALRSYYKANDSRDRQIFLLRNLSRGKGIGFFRTAGFYPDFIVWTKVGEKQRVVFVEPHGMRNEDAPEYNDKIRLFEDLREISARPGYENITLDSFIVSATPFDELKVNKWVSDWSLETFAKHHIIFEDDLQKKMPLILYGENF